MEGFHSLYLAGKLFYFFIAILAGGLGVLYGVARAFSRSFLPKRWARAEGVIIRSEVELLDGYDGEPEKAPEDCKHATLEYAFEVDGRNFESRIISLYYRPPKPGPDELIALYPKGAKVTVYYSRSNPKDCALNCRMPTKIMLMLIGAVLSVFAVWFAFIFFFFGGLTGKTS